MESKKAASRDIKELAREVIDTGRLTLRRNSIVQKNEDCLRESTCELIPMILESRSIDLGEHERRSRTYSSGNECHRAVIVIAYHKKSRCKSSTPKPSLDDVGNPTSVNARQHKMISFFRGYNVAGKTVLKGGFYVIAPDHLSLVLHRNRPISAAVTIEPVIESHLFLLPAEILDIHHLELSRREFEKALKELLFWIGDLMLAPPYARSRTEELCARPGCLVAGAHGVAGVRSAFCYDDELQPWHDSERLRCRYVPTKLD
uniref:Uncharacterized protein n=1 Tax=Vespula pensylvanica TaxID=30213 RepID=A0A834P7G3_VESPE|nr:hypothetical protein H0235_004421 [Vespula pensylvanica]